MPSLLTLSARAPFIQTFRDCVPMRANAPIINDVWEVPISFIEGRGFTQADVSKPGGCLQVREINQTNFKARAVLHNAQNSSGVVIHEVVELSLAEAVASGWSLSKAKDLSLRTKLWGLYTPA